MMLDPTKTFDDLVTSYAASPERAERILVNPFYRNIAGALSGIAGYIEVAGVSQRINGEFSTGYGFTAIIVALLGRLHPVGVLVAALGFAALNIGFDVAERSYDLPSSLIGLVQALIIIFVVIGDAIAGRSTFATSRT